MKKVGVVLGVIALLSLACAVGSFAADLPWTLTKGSAFIGADVKNLQGENLGDIKDIVIDRASGRIVYAVVSFGGFLGLGEKLFAVPWNAFSQSTAHKDTFVLAIDKERLKNAPGFDHNNWPQIASRKWVSNLYTYYDVAPFWTAPTASPMTSATVRSSDRYSLHTLPWRPTASPMTSTTVKSVDPAQKTITLQVDEQMLKNPPGR